MKNFPHKYFFYGSENSNDTDVILIVDKLSSNKEENIQYIKTLQLRFNLDWNMNMIVIDGGIVVNCIPSKGSVYALNNSLYETL